MRQTFREYFQRIYRKAHAYPPMELYRPLDIQEVHDAWAAFAREDRGRPFGVYVHVPFCERKCTFCYCDTIITDDQDRIARYLEALHREIDVFASVLGDTPMSTLYLGGGTPTWIAPEQLDALLEALTTRFSPTKDLHLNVEGTPGSITQEIADVLQKHRTTRITLGIQSLDETILAQVNRPQTLDQIEAAVMRLRRAGVRYLNFDLVGGLPDDTEAQFDENLHRLLDLGPDMVHVYPFTEKPGFKRNEEKERIVWRSQETLRERGFRAIKNDGWGRSEDSRNMQVIDKVEHAGSCLGLGIRSRSHIFNRLAYRSQLTRDYVDSLLEGNPPEYWGYPMTRGLQVQRYLMDNLQQGMSVSDFHDLFGGDPVALLRRRYPQLARFLEKGEGDEIALKEPFRSGHELNGVLFDGRLRGQLYSRFIRQPEGWPVKEMTPDRVLDPDLNWAAFLGIHLSKGNTYPPIERDARVTDAQVQDAWKDWVARVKKGEALETVGLYCHVPFCASICKFCYCYKGLLDSPDTLERYVDALLRQIDRIAPTFEGIRFASYYFGGGTPSILKPQQLDRLLTRIREVFPAGEDFQFNFEGTPQTLTRDGRLEVLARHGCDRVTIGIQSLDRDLLDDMNRAQAGSSVVKRAIDEARAAGIRYINTDIMSGLPDQTFDQFRETLDTLISWRPDVIHPYPFQPTTETTYYKEGFRVTPEVEAERARMQDYAREALAAGGYKEVPHDSWALSLGARNKQDIDKIVDAASILPLGYNARGHVFGGLSYGIVEQEYRAFMDDPEHLDFYYGLPVTLEDDMVRYLISNLLTGIDRPTFHRLFGEDVLERFWPQFRWLQEHGKVQVTRTRIASRFDSSLDTVLYGKLFFSDAYHELLRERFAQQYDPDRDYVAELTAMYDKAF